MKEKWAIIDLLEMQNLRNMKNNNLKNDPQYVMLVKITYNGKVYEK